MLGSVSWRGRRAGEKENMEKIYTRESVKHENVDKKINHQSVALLIVG